MGFYRPSMEVTAHLSPHNSRKDRIDNLLYEELVERVRAVVQDPAYERIEPMVVRDGIDWGGEVHQ